MADIVPVARLASRARDKQYYKKFLETKRTKGVGVLGEADIVAEWFTQPDTVVDASAAGLPAASMLDDIVYGVANQLIKEAVYAAADYAKNKAVSALVTAGYGAAVGTAIGGPLGTAVGYVGGLIVGEVANIVANRVLTDDSFHEEVVNSMQLSARQSLQANAPGAVRGEAFARTVAPQYALAMSGIVAIEYGNSEVIDVFLGNAFLDTEKRTLVDVDEADITAADKSVASFVKLTAGLRAELADAITLDDSVWEGGKL